MTAGPYSYHFTGNHRRRVQTVVTAAPGGGNSTALERGIRSNPCMARGLHARWACASSAPRCSPCSSLRSPSCPRAARSDQAPMRQATLPRSASAAGAAPALTIGSAAVDAALISGAHAACASSCGSLASDAMSRSLRAVGPRPARAACARRPRRSAVVAARSSQRADHSTATTSSIVRSTTAPTIRASVSVSRVDGLAARVTRTPAVALEVRPASAASALPPATRGLATRATIARAHLVSSASRTVARVSQRRCRSAPTAAPSLAAPRVSRARRASSRERVKTRRIR